MVGFESSADERRAGAGNRHLDTLQGRSRREATSLQPNIDGAGRCAGAGRVVLPIFDSASQEMVRSRLSPPSRRCRPTVVRVNSTRSPSRSTRTKREIAGAAADVADENYLAIEQFFVRPGEMSRRSRRRMRRPVLRAV